MQRRIVPDIMLEGRALLELPVTASAYDAACALRDWGVGAVLVTDGGRLAGIFTKRDMIDRVVACGREPKATPLAEVMTAEPSTVSPKATALEALRLMDDGGYRHLPVVAGTRLVGIVSRRDFVGAEKAQLDSETSLWERL